MSVPHQPETPGTSGINDDELVRYLLGLLPEDETERLDEACVADDAMADRLRVVEDDLVNAYLRGELDGSTLDRFETYYLASPARREHVRFAASLVRAVDRAAPPRARTAAFDAAAAAPAAATAVQIAQANRTRARTWLVPGLAAAAVLLLAATGALVSETARLNRGLATARQENATLDRRANELEHQLEGQRSSTAAAQNELARARESGAAAPASGGRSGASAVSAIALVLLPQTRAIGPIPALALSHGADRVAFDLRLETQDFHEYQVGLRDPATNDVIWRSDWTTARVLGDQASVSLAVPAGLLKAQHYSLELTGRGGTDGGQVVGSYAFQIVPR
jgi:hypothetical protein